MFWLRNKKNNFQMRTLIWRPVNYFDCSNELTINDILCPYFRRTLDASKMCIIYPGNKIRLPCNPGHFSWVPNKSLAPPECEMKLSSKEFGMGYVKMHGFYGNPHVILENGDRPTNSIPSRVLLILDH